MKQHVLLPLNVISAATKAHTGSISISRWVWSWTTVDELLRSDCFSSYFNLETFVSAVYWDVVRGLVEGLVAGGGHQCSDGFSLSQVRGQRSDRRGWTLHQFDI